MKKIQDDQISLKELNLAATIFNCLAHPTRLEIANLLEDGKSKTVGHILSEVDVEPTLLSHHLAKMKNSGILESFRKGRYVFYRLTTKEIKPIFSYVQNLSRNN